MAIDNGGTVYVADSENSRIRKIAASGVVATLAGSANSGYKDGTGSAAQFAYPVGLAVDVNGNVYVGDTGNDRIRKITASGIVTTLAGSTRGYKDGVGTAAQFNGPVGVAVDVSGNVYVGDAGNNRIRKITSSGLVTTLAGSSQFYYGGYQDGAGTVAQFSSPQGVALDASGNIYVADSSNNRIRKVTPSGVVTTFAGSSQLYYGGSQDGAGTIAQFYNPEGVAVDVNGNVYVGDNKNNRIRKITPGGSVTTLGGSTQGYKDGNGMGARFSWPKGVTVSVSGNVYVADSGNNRIRKIVP